MYTYKIETSKDETFFNIDLWGVDNGEIKNGCRFPILDYFIKFIYENERLPIALKIVERWLNSENTVDCFENNLKSITEKLTASQRIQLKEDLINNILKFINSNKK